MRKTIKFEIDEVEHELPAKYEVCDRCVGEGRHTNPAIDGNGLSKEDFDEQGPEFFEDYMSGVYDVRCEGCKGERVVLVVNEDALDTPELQELFKEYCVQLEEEASYRAMCEAERRMGA